MLAASFGVAFGILVSARTKTSEASAESRHGHLVSGFKAEFAELSERRIREAHDFMREQVGIPGFPIQVEDNLWDTLELDQGKC